MAYKRLFEEDFISDKFSKIKVSNMNENFLNSFIKKMKVNTIYIMPKNFKYKDICIYYFEIGNNYGWYLNFNGKNTITAKKSSPAGVKTFKSESSAKLNLINYLESEDDLFI